MSAAVDAATNRIAGAGYDANANQSVGLSAYDVENRINWYATGGGAGTAYGYDTDNRRVYKAPWSLVLNGQGDFVWQVGVEEVTFWRTL